MYQRYLADPTSVDPAWHDFFADYKPAMATGSIVTPGRGDRGQRHRLRGQGRHRRPGRHERRARSSRPCRPRRRPPKPAPGPRGQAGHAGSEGCRQREGAARAPRSPRCAASPPGSCRTWTPRSRCRRATSVRAVPAKLLVDNRIVINNHLARGRGGKVSFTHLIGWALVRSVIDHPEMNNSFAEVDGKPALVAPEHINLGIAIDLAKKDGTRTLVVPSIKNCEQMDFRKFWQAYEDVVRRARRNELTMDDYTGTTISLTNPGGIGTVHSIPRLMTGQSAIIGVGAMEYPAPYSGMSDETLSDHGVSKVTTLTSTYDHRVIQGAQSGEFLKAMHELLLGEHAFYDDIFTSLRIPYEPVRWVRDVARTSEGQIDKAARVVELIHAYRVRGHLMADTDPLEFEIRRHPDLDVLQHGLTLWDLDRTFPVGGFAGKQKMKLRDVLGVLRDTYCRRVGIEYMHIQGPEERRWIQDRIEIKYTKPDQDEQKHVLNRLNAAEAFETFLQTKYVGQKRFSLEGGESLIPLLDEVLQASAEARPGRDGHRHGPPRPAERAGQHRRQAVREDLQRVRGSDGPEVGARLRRRQVPPGPDRQVHDAGRRERDDGQRGRQPVAPGGRRPGARGHRPGQAGPPGPGPARLHGAAGAGARRRRVRRPGRGRRDAQPVPAARLPHRRHRARGGQQPGRLHHRPGVQPLVALLDRRGPDDPGADLPRERRRPRGRRPGGQAGLRVPPDVQQGRRDRHGLLPPPRAQRGRRPVDDQPPDVPDHRHQAQRPEALHRGADRPRRPDRRRRAGAAARLPAAARAGLQGHPGRGRFAAAGPAQPHRRAGAGGRDRGRHRRGTRGRPGPRRPAGGLHAAQAGPAAPGAPGEDVRRGRHRLGLRRADRVRLAAAPRA